MKKILFTFVASATAVASSFFATSQAFEPQKPVEKTLYENKSQKEGPVFLFVHGGMLGGWCWEKVRDHLEVKNCVVITPTLTGLGERKHLSNPDVDLNTHINDIVNIIDYENLTDVILVGHSYGGMVITGVADRLPQKIKQLIYIDGLLPQQGDSMFSIIDPAIVSYLVNQAKKEGDGWQVPAPPIDAYDFADKEDRVWLAGKSTPQPIKSFEQPLHLKHPSQFFDRYYIKCLQYSYLDSMADRAKSWGFSFHTIDSGHFPMVTNPDELAVLLKDISQ